MVPIIKCLDDFYKFGFTGEFRVGFWLSLGVGLGLGEALRVLLKVMMKIQVLGLFIKHFTHRPPYAVVKDCLVLTYLSPLFFP